MKILLSIGLAWLSGILTCVAFHETISLDFDDIFEIDDK